MKKLAFLFLFFSISGALFSQNLQDSLLFFYPFNGNVDDYSGNGLHMTNVGVTYGLDRHGHVLGAGIFDGIDDYLILPNSPRLKVQMPVTISFWVFPESYAMSQTKFINTETQYDDYLGFRVNCSDNGAGEVRAGFGGGLGFAGYGNRRNKNSDSTITGGKWYNITCVYRAYNDMDIYINCVNAAGYYDGSGPTTVAYENRSGRVGSFEATSLLPETFFEGRLDDMAMWHRALNATEVTWICDSSLNSIFSHNPIENNLIQSIFPNPFSELATIQLDNNNEEYTFSMFNVLGELVREESSRSNTIIINRNNLSPGVYFFCISIEGIIEDSGKLIVQ